MGLSRFRAHEGCQNPPSGQERTPSGGTQKLKLPISQNMSNKVEGSEPGKRKRFKDAVLLTLILVIFIPYVIIAYLIPQFFIGIYLRFAFAWSKIRKGEYILFVYSNSRLWKDYMEQKVVPKIKDHAAILNWSERSQWDHALWMIRAFHHWGGDREYNPLAIVYRNFWVVRIFRFYKLFYDYKHGKADSLRKVETSLFESVHVDQSIEP